jgi:hypothetical protein
MKTVIISSIKEETQEFEIKKWELSPAVNHQQEA